VEIGLAMQHERGLVSIANDGAQMERFNGRAGDWHAKASVQHRRGDCGKGDEKIMRVECTSVALDWLLLMVFL